MGKYLSDEELIATINHSSEPFIIVEGQEDVMIYRWMLDDIGFTAYLEPRDGCENVKKMYDRRNEIKNSNVIFICDKDTIVYTDVIPKGYEDIIYTTGYSIENDLYQGRAIEKKLFETKDSELFEKALNSFLRYYACELEKFKKKENCNFNEKPEAIIDKSDYSLRLTLLKDFKEPSSATISYLKSKYDVLIRGHSLFKLVGMILNRQNRRAKYKVIALYEMCYKFCKSDYIKSLQNIIKGKLIEHTKITQTKAC